MDDNINSIRHKRNQGHKEDFFKGAMWFGASMNYGQTLYGSFNLSPAIWVLLNTSVPRVSLINMFSAKPLQTINSKTSLKEK